MMTARRTEPRPTWAAAILLALMLAGTLAACSAPKTAMADEPGGGADKEAIPTVDKAVSAGGAFAKEAQGQAGTELTYRLIATMPEDVAQRESLMYRIVDEPPSAVTVDWSTVHAYLQTAKGKHKADVEVAVATAANGATMHLADLKATDPNLAFGDVVVVEYKARISPNAAAGLHRNVAYLEYLFGETWESTVKVQAIVTVSSPAKTASGPTSGYDKTGDYLARFWPLAAIAGLALVAVGVYMTASDKRARAKQDPPQSGGNANLQ